MLSASTERRVKALPAACTEELGRVGFKFEPHLRAAAAQCEITIDSTAVRCASHSKSSCGATACHARMCPDMWAVKTGPFTPPATVAAICADRQRSDQAVGLRLAGQPPTEESNAALALRALLAKRCTAK